LDTRITRIQLITRMELLEASRPWTHLVAGLHSSAFHQATLDLIRVNPHDPRNPRVPTF